MRTGKRRDTTAEGNGEDILTRRACMAVSGKCKLSQESPTKLNPVSTVASVAHEGLLVTGNMAHSYRGLRSQINMHLLLRPRGALGLF